MPISVGLVVGEFRYLERFKLGEYLAVLVGKIEQGTVAEKMLLQMGGGKSVPVIGVEAYGNGNNLKYGLLVHASEVEDNWGVDFVHGAHIFIMQNVPIAKSHEETTFKEMALLADAVNETRKLDSPS
jgi:hypothetical protein